MTWLYYVVADVLTDSLRIYIDNYTSDVYFKEKGAFSQRLVYGVMATVVGAIFVLFSMGDFALAPMMTFFLFFLSGVISAISAIPYYAALEHDDSTNLGIFIQLAPVMYLVLGWLFLGDTISPMQLVSFFIILSAPLLIVFSSRKRSRGVRIKAMLFAFLYVLFNVSGNLLFVHAHDASLGFFTEIGVCFVGAGLTNALIVLLTPKLRKRFFFVVKRSKRKALPSIIMGAVMNMAMNVSYRAALTFAPAVALASVSTDAVEPVVIFFMGIVLSLIWPKFGREKLNKKSVCVHLLATVIVVIGIILMQIQ